MNEQNYDKETAMAPKFHGNGDIRCPRCGDLVVFKFDRGSVKVCSYCPDCGQHIDWMQRENVG